jgi:photosystem II stability/assembly factor-like uncharacterized protein
MNLSAQEWDRNGPFSAHVISLAIAPSDTSVIYVGTYCDGVYKSLDGAENWINCSIENLPTWEDSLNNSPTLPCWWYGDYYPVQSIVIDPANAEHLWIGTEGRGLFESNDGGISWQQANEMLPDSLNVDHIHINENNPDELFIGAGTGFHVPPLENSGLYHTINGGNNWELVENVPYGDTYHISCISNEPDNEEHLYVGVDSAGEPGFSWGLMESIDCGNEWQIIMDDFPIYDLSINPDDNQNMWSIIITSFQDILLASSTDGGYNWTPYPNLYNPELWLTSLYADIEYNLYVAKGWGYTSAGYVKKSSDNGITWVYIDTLCAGRGVYLRNRCKTNRENTNNIYFGTYCGIYKSDNGGFNCRLENYGINNSYIKEIESHPYNSDILYAGGEQGLWKSINSGIYWHQESDESISSVKYDPQHPDTLYYGGQNLMRSFDGGLTFEDIRHNVVGDIVDISINPQCTNIVYIVSVYYGTRVYKTENYGDTWNLIHSTGSANYPMVTIDPNYPDTLYFADYRSVDGGNVWECLVSSYEIIGIHPQNSNTIYYSNRSTLKVSYDWGETFQVLDTYSNWTTPVPAIVNLVFDKNNPDNMFYCTPNDGIHYSTDAGENWFVLEGNYENRTLDFIPILEENKVYVATHGDGVWIGENISVSIDNTILPEIMQLSLQNYPNPFNPQTNISFNLTRSSKISLSIYNIKGQLVKKLIDNETFQKGSHSVMWNGNDEFGNSVSSGLYFFQLKVNGKSEAVKKCLLLK